MPQDADTRQHRTPSRSRLGIDFEADRTPAFRRARRNTIMVRALRVLLPVSVLGLLSSYVVFMQRSISISLDQGKTVSADKVSISTQALIATNPRYEGFDNKGGRFIVRSRTAKQAIGQKGPVLLNAIDGNLIDAADVVTNLTARAGTFDTGTNILELFEQIDVVSQNGMRAKLTRATVRAKDGIITSDQPVVVSMPSGVVHGKALRIEQKQRIVTFSGGVLAQLRQQARPGQPAPAGRLAAGDEPVDITSATLRIDDAARLATFTGKVVAAQAGSTLETEALEVAYEGNAASQPSPGGAQASPAVASPKAASPGATPGAGRVKRMIARQPLVLTRGVEKATGSSGEFDATRDRATLFGPVELTAGPDRKATSDRADFDSIKDTILLTGNVVVTQQENILKGASLFVDRKAGTMAMTAPGGRVSAHLKQAAASPQKAAARPKPPQAVALLGAGANQGEPVDILADRLDVDDGRKQAIFRGKVEARQGDYTLISDELVAVYSGASGMVLSPPPEAALAAKSGKASAAQGGAQLQKVYSRQRLKVVTKDGRTATGDTAEFDIKANTVLLTGNVVLTQGQSITRGPRAKIDLGRGAMQLLENATAAAEQGVRKQRVEALFFPQQLQDAAKAAREGAAATARGLPTGRSSVPTDSGGWSSTTAPVPRNGNSRQGVP